MAVERFYKDFEIGWDEVMWSRVKERERKRRRIDGGLGV